MKLCFPQRLSPLSALIVATFFHCSAYSQDHLLNHSLEGMNATHQFRTLLAKEQKYRESQYPKRKDNNESKIAFDLSYAAEKARLPKIQSFLDESKKINTQVLSREDRINHQIFQSFVQNQINRIQYDAMLLAFNSDSQFWTDYTNKAENARCQTTASCQSLLRSLAQLPHDIEQRIALLRIGLKKGMTQPQVVLIGRDKSIEKQIVQNAEESAFYRAFQKLPSSMPDNEKAELQKQAEELVIHKIVPAYTQLLRFLREDYFPNARHPIAAESLPNGKAFYRAQILEYTTLNTSPDDIHQIGLNEVARIRKEMNQIIKDVKFQGDFQDFLTFLRTDPQFYAKSEHELLAEASYWAKKADGMLPMYFGKLPRKPYGIAPIPADLAPTYTAGRYAGNPNANRPSYYWVNTSLLNQRPLWALPALTLHEAVPGHHLQAALAEEQTQQPDFRRNTYISAFGEGWALYTERLGIEMDYYETPYQHFGRLVYEMWRASRLVVDTGIHAKAWSREQAVQFMRDNTALSEHEIQTEIDRYISWPAQALSYKLGEIKIRELRQLAEQRLGEHFSLKEFHDTLLGLGSVPLSVMDDEIKEWIQNQLASTQKH